MAGGVALRVIRSMFKLLVINKCSLVEMELLTKDFKMKDCFLGCKDGLTTTI
ncbi:unnamed protein product [Arabidopsis thaliana]|uniref:Uncharacterized protein n=4 Tax=Arabidopsis TaxID=3701 RepID=A0A654EEZ3_ARATH|nr:uncharacterized protein AT1G33640 [Arabidopsis thaliana]KAG7648368.1 hypothetical protein ISN45_At01g033320 [Arabidopsis thaliana x Arabidopsis arenosa]KAG7656292.1 hypothetical protein ISN44_As01g032890 [Arabidopsis suecica]AAG26080.1 hypothetical protein [Arabidopsis thaliana]AEE31611.1 hypothetical protein AT1G33640 [Arabidopsis thaliana]CAA0264568.1 unnamed protein product [Arabidopsis thaliana]|eukprot:NP_174626.1 hypothetical protein AT1G33640 [Arabidopsis thaliana]